MRNNVTIILVASLMVSCGQTRDAALHNTLKGLSEMAELGVVEYTVKKIVSADDENWYTIGDRKILFTCTAFIKAGINLSDFSEESVRVEGKEIMVSLPKPQVLSFNMPPEEIKEEFTKITGLRGKFSPEEKQYLLVLGEKNIKESIPEMGILQDAEDNARSFFTALLSKLGYKTITITFE